MWSRYAQCTAGSPSIRTVTTSVKQRRLHLPPSCCDIAVEHAPICNIWHIPHVCHILHHRIFHVRHIYHIRHVHHLRHFGSNPPNLYREPKTPLIMSVNSVISALPAYKTLSAFVYSGTTDPKALDDTVQEFKDLAKKAETEIEDFLWDTYNAIFAVASQTPAEKQGPLVDFLQRLRETTVTASGGQPLKLSNQVVWKGLPTFGWVARDVWNFDVLDSSASKEDKASWNNLTAFFAQLTARADPADPQDPFDFSLYGLWALRTAFEENHAADADVAAAVKQAYLWIKYSGDALQKLSVKTRNFEGKSGQAGAKFVNREWKGLNEERWAAWTEAFASAQSSLTDEEAKGLAGKAAESMKSN
ncbi:hypothetical protein CTA2_12447 [Colletotrichum tanaceti]|uniref:Uncharacterized protein n=1 Tax=Colletotrichum tanaceti TaxID=1306861 RepID=A0A4U6X827_9PEZI|nr:hypothetical protein CTA2_12447 [Colletotrichum tanaceti]TKW51670.1 hypothetical protein CTA1_2813 [Colletotrichum tanaceti]